MSSASKVTSSTFVSQETVTAQTYATVATASAQSVAATKVETNGHANGNGKAGRLAQSEVEEEL